MLKGLLRVAAMLSLAGSGVCTYIWNYRRALPYDEQGRYFDASAAVVLNVQAVEFYGLSALGLAVSAFIFWLISRK